MANERFTDTVDGTTYIGHNDGDQLFRTGESSERCAVCGFSYRKGKMKRFEGLWYGVPCGCYKDIYDIIKERKGKS